MRRSAVLMVLLLVLPLAGCTTDAPPATTTTTTPTSPTPGIRLTFAGIVLDALDGGPLRIAELRLDLAHTEPCQRQSLIWASWELTVGPDGRFGPFELAAPDSPTQRFFLHARAPGYTSEVRFIGPQQAAEAANLTIVLHPELKVNGSAPPGTVLALASKDFPRLTVADARGTFAFEGARLGAKSFVAATEVPDRRVVEPPEVVHIETNGTGWVLRGVARTEGGTGQPVDVVAWNGTTLWSAARANEAGHFALPLPAEGVKALRIEARSSDGKWGGTLVRDVNGPSATQETVLLRARC